MAAACNGAQERKNPGARSSPEYHRETASSSSLGVWRASEPTGCTRRWYTWQVDPSGLCRTRYAPAMTYRRMRQAVQARRYGREDAAPRGSKADRVTPSDVADTRKRSGPVKTWADMTAEERERVMAQLRRSQ